MKAIEKMKVGNTDKSDIGEHIRLRVHYSKVGVRTFCLTIPLFALNSVIFFRTSLHFLIRHI